MAEAPAGFSPTLATTLNPQTGVRDDLAAFQQAARSSKTAFRVMSTLTGTATDDQSQSFSVQTLMYFINATADAGSKNAPPALTASKSGLTIRPRFNKDGTVTVELRVVKSHPADMARPGSGVPTTVSETFTTRHTFRDGDTALVGGGDVPHGKEARFYFATIAVTPGRRYF